MHGDIATKVQALKEIFMHAVLAKLSELGLIEGEALTRAQTLWHEGHPIEHAVLSADGLTADQVLPIVAKEAGSQYVDVDQMVPDTELLRELPAKLLLEHKMLPLSREGNLLKMAVGSLFDTSGLDELRVISGYDMLPVLGDPRAIERGLRKHLGLGAETVQSLVADKSGVETLDETSDNIDLSEDASDASIIKFVNQILVDAIQRRATDVHIEPFEGKLVVRFRIDGVLVDAAVPTDIRRFQAAIVSRIKILSHLDIAEKRLPQDGRIKLRVSNREVDVRVSIIPMLFGEAVVLRLLDRSGTLTGLVGLGMCDQDLSSFKKILGLPHGIVLVTGPTGSGKTTTLYAALAQINDIERKIITIEDPIEYHLDGVNQIQVDTRTGLTFARGLRAILRHDPDVLLIGEIRDRETAEIAVQASLTGHLVFSTLHTNDAPGALTRLVDMGIEPFLVASSLEMVVAQRLVRLICPHCKEAIPIESADLIRDELGSDLPDTLYHGRGCTECGGTGYLGRRGIFEMLPISDDIRTQINHRDSAHDIRRTAVDEGMRSLREDGWRMIREGLTTVEELLRVTKDERHAIVENGAPT